jgi:hypothetical protein
MLWDPWQKELSHLWHPEPYSHCWCLACACRVGKLNISGVPRTLSILRMIGNNKVLVPHDLNVCLTNSWTKYKNIRWEWLGSSKWFLGLILPSWPYISLTIAIHSFWLEIHPVDHFLKVACGISDPFLLLFTSKACLSFEPLCFLVVPSLWPHYLPFISKSPIPNHIGVKENRELCWCWWEVFTCKMIRSFTLFD